MLKSFFLQWKCSVLSFESLNLFSEGFILLAGPLLFLKVLCFLWRVPVLLLKDFILFPKDFVLSVDTSILLIEGFVLNMKTLFFSWRFWFCSWILHIILPVWLNHDKWEEMANRGSSNKLLVFLKEYLSFEPVTFSLSCTTQGLCYGPGGWLHPS